MYLIQRPEQTVMIFYFPNIQSCNMETLIWDLEANPETGRSAQTLAWMVLWGAFVLSKNRLKVTKLAPCQVTLLRKFVVSHGSLNPAGKSKLLKPENHLLKCTHFMCRYHRCGQRLFDCCSCWNTKTMGEFLSK